MKPIPFTSYRTPVSVFVLVMLASMTASAQVPTFAPVTGLSGGAVSVVATSQSASSPQVAVVVDGLGLYASSAPDAALTGSAVTWTAQSCDACAWSKTAAFDDAGRLWVAASGYGLWRGAANSAYSEVKLSDSNIAQWVARGADGSIWVATGNAVLQVQAGDKVTVRGTNAARLGIHQLALPPAANGSVFASGNGEVYQLGGDNTWKPLKVPRDPLSIAQAKGTLYVGTVNGVLQWSGTAWSELGPNGSRVNAIALATDGSLVVATERQGVQRLKAGKWTATMESTSFADRRALALTTDAAGSVYAGLASGLQLPTSLLASGPSGRSQTDVNAALNVSLGAAAIQHVVATRNDTYALIEGQGIYSRVGRSNRWEAVNDGLDDEPVRLAGSDTAAYVLTASGSIFSFRAPTSSAGAWVKLTSIASPVHEFAVGNDDTIWVATTNGMVLSRDARRERWAATTKGLEGSGRVNRFLVSPTGTVFAGTSKGGVFRWDAVKASWSVVAANGMPLVATYGGQGRSPVNALIQNDGALYVGTEHGVFTVATDAGADATWSPLTKGLIEPLVTSLAIDRRGNLVAGTVNGAYVIAPTAAGAEWAPYSDTVGNVVASLTRVGDDIVIATRKQPGKPARTVAGG